MENNNLWIISIVAIVAIVGMVFVFSVGKTTYVPQGENYVYADAQADIAGQAIKNTKTKIIDGLDTTCEVDSDCAGVAVACINGKCRKLAD
jgi:hypothetical protein